MGTYQSQRSPKVEKNQGRATVSLSIQKSITVSSFGAETKAAQI